MSIIDIIPGALPPKEWADYRRRLKQIGKQRVRRCPYCGNWMARQIETLDHVRPRCRGGNDSPRNLLVVCSPCNLAKADRSPLQLIAWAFRVALAGFFQKIRGAA
jgi:5-methylcytosine-specific restriction endonuclease McrA